MRINKLIAVFVLSAMLIGAMSGCAETADNEVKEPNTENSDDTIQENDGTNTDSSSGDEPYSFCSEGLDEHGFFEGVTASDYITLPEYKGITLAPVTEDEIKEQVDAICEGMSYYEHTEGTVQDGDTVNIDYVGYVDGVAFDGGNTMGQGTTVTIGVTSYIDGFLEQLVGHETGENFDINVTFPDPYLSNEELSGKDAVFNITINYIVGDVVVPEISDEIAQQNGFDSVEELRADIERWLYAQKAMEFIFANVDCGELPPEVVAYYRNYMEGYYENYSLMNYGVSLETFMGYLGYESFDLFYDTMYDDVFALAVRALTYQAIAEEEGLTVTDEDIETYGYSALSTYYGLGYTSQIVLQEYIVPNFLVEYAVIE